MIDRIAALCGQGVLAKRGDAGGLHRGLIEALADGAYDLAAAHRNSGFTAPLLQVCDRIFEGLPAENAPAFALALVRAARVDANISEIARDFMKWMFEEAVADLGPSRIRSTAREAGQVFERLFDVGDLAPGQAQKAKALAKRARRRGLSVPTKEDVLVAQVLAAALDRGGEHAWSAVHWVAGLADQPADQYRRYANKLLELVENA